MASIILLTHFPSLEKISPVQLLFSWLAAGWCLGTLEKHWDCLGFFLISWEKLNQQTNVEALSGKSCPDLCVEKKVNAVITRQILQFQVYVTFMGQWGKSPAQLLNLSSVCRQQSQTLHQLCSKSQEKMGADKIWDESAVAEMRG